MFPDVLVNTLPWLLDRLQQRRCRRLRHGVVTWLRGSLWLPTVNEMKRGETGHLLYCSGVGERQIKRYRVCCLVFNVDVHQLRVGDCLVQTFRRSICLRADRSSFPVRRATHGHHVLHLPACESKGCPLVGDDNFSSCKIHSVTNLATSVAVPKEAP